MRNVVRPTGVRADRLQVNLPEETAKHKRRRGGPTLQQLLRLANARSDPLLGRNPKSSTAFAAQRLDVGPKWGDTGLERIDRGSNGSAIRSLAATNDIDQVVELLTSLRELGLLASAHLGDVALQLRNLDGNAVDSMAGACAIRC